MENEREDRYLADIMCKRKSKKDGIPLPLAYWNITFPFNWKLFYRQQLMAANSLLKIYPFSVITATISNKKVDWCYSLRFPGLKQILEEEQSKYERKKLIEESKPKKVEVHVESTEQAPMIMETGKSLKSKLD